MRVRDIIKNTYAVEEPHPNAKMAKAGRKVTVTKVRHIAVIEVPLREPPSFDIGDEITPAELGRYALPPAPAAATPPKQEG